MRAFLKDVTRAESLLKPPDGCYLVAVGAPSAEPQDLYWVATAEMQEFLTTIRSLYGKHVHYRVYEPM
jgi:hypothetical protein